jgi:LacI family transcriptional regulator
MPRPSVALLIETSNTYSRGLLDGVIGYMRCHDPWSVYLPEQERGARPPDWLARWKGDGIIARIETDDIAQVVSQMNLPTVDVSAGRRVPGAPLVETDDEAIARLAVDHLLERGFRRFAYCGDPGFPWSNQRRDHFQRFVGQAGHECHVHDSLSRWDKDYTWEHERCRLMTWVRDLPKPIGVMACYDIKAQQLLDVCRDLNVAAPEEFAVIGVDNDDLLCNLCDPPLTSIAPDTYRTGYAAAESLDRLMSGQAVSPAVHLVHPLGIIARQSTNVMAVDDPEIVEALRYIRENACTGITVTQILQHVSLSRRVLEGRFRKLLGRTPHEEIMRLRIERVKQLLSETDLSLAAIADRAGFRHVEYLSFAFKREVGVPPSDYRTSR